MCTILIEALTPLNRISCIIKMYKNIARSRLFCRIAKRSIVLTGIVKQLGMNMIIVAIFVLRFLVKLRFPANTPNSVKPFKSRTTANTPLWLRTVTLPFFVLNRHSIISLRGLQLKLVFPLVYINRMSQTSHHHFLQSLLLWLQSFGLVRAFQSQRKHSLHADSRRNIKTEQGMLVLNASVSRPREGTFRSTNIRGAAAGKSEKPSYPGENFLK